MNTVPTDTGPEGAANPPGSNRRVIFEKLEKDIDPPKFRWPTLNDPVPQELLDHWFGPDLKTNEVFPYDTSKALTANELIDGFEFDWYEATLLAVSTAKGRTANRDEERAGARTLMALLSSLSLHPQSYVGGATKSYGSALNFKTSISDNAPIARLSHASYRGNMPHIAVFGAKGKGNGIALAVQEAGFPFALSRADARLDLSIEGGWDALYNIVTKTAENNEKLKPPEIMQGSNGGKTFYFGARSSAVRLRVYQKDLERVAAGDISSEDADPNLIRIEFQFRPETRLAIDAARKTPSQLVKSSPMARKFMTAVARLLNKSGDVEIVKNRAINRCRNVFDSEAHGFYQYQRSFARAALSLIVDDMNATITDDGCIIAPITARMVEDLMVRRFRDYVKESGIARKVIDEHGLTEGLHADPEDRAKAIMVVADRNRVMLVTNRLTALAESLDLFVDQKLPSNLIENTMQKIQSMEEQLDDISADLPGTLDLCWEHRHPISIYREGLDHYLASRGLRRSPLPECDPMHGFELVSQEPEKTRIIPNFIGPMG